MVPDSDVMVKAAGMVALGVEVAGGGGWRVDNRWVADEVGKSGGCQVV